MISKQCKGCARHHNAGHYRKSFTNYNRAIKATVLAKFGEPVGYLCKVGLPEFERELNEHHDKSKWDPVFKLKD